MEGQGSSILFISRTEKPGRNATRFQSYKKHSPGLPGKVLTTQMCLYRRSYAQKNILSSI